MLAAGHRLVGQHGSEFTVQQLIAEAGVALQTFYRYFGGRDHLLVALLADQIAEHCTRLRAAAADEPDPLARLRQHIQATLLPLGEVPEIGRARFVAAEHWRLHRLLPREVRAATLPFTELIADELEAGRRAGVLPPAERPDRTASLVMKTVMAAVHDHAALPEGPIEQLADDLCAFCVAAVGGVLP